MTILDITEKQWLEQIRQLAKQTGWLTYHTHRSRKSEPGFPDLVLVHPTQGRLIFAELKSATGQLTEKQHEWMVALTTVARHAEWDCRGSARRPVVEAHVWRPDDLQQVAQALTGKPVALQ